MKQMKSVWPIRLILAMASVLGIVIAGYVSPRAFSGQELGRMGEGAISSDGWIGDRVEVALPSFMPLVNVLNLSFNPIRPGATEPGRVAIALCGGAEREFEIQSTDPVSLPIPAGCSPLRVSVRGLSFFSPPREKTPRVLSAQILSARVSSPLRVPIVSMEELLPTALLIVLLVTLIMVSAARAGFSTTVAGLIGIVVIGSFVFGVNGDREKLLPLGIAVTSAFLGMSVWSHRWDERARGGVGSTAILVLALLIGAALRLYGIRFGLPSNFHPDEVPKVNAIMRMVDGNTLDPNYFLHPSLLLYSTYGVNKVLHLLGVQGSFRETAFLAGRLVSAMAGMASIVLTYLIGRRLFSREVGSAAALLLAVFPLHVTCSRYLKEDALLTFVVLSCVLTAIVAVQSGRRWVLLVSGLLAGCTAGTKYSGILMVVVPASVPWIASRSWKPDWSWIPWAVAAVMVAPLGFVMTTPYSILNSAKFLKDFNSESRHMQTGHTVSITAWSQLWMYHFWRSVWPGVTGVVAVAALAGLGFLLRRGRIEDLLVVGLALLFYLPAEYVKAKPAPQPERYILPCLPFLALSAAEVLRQVARRGVGHRYIAALCACVLIVFPLRRAVSLAADITNDTRDRMALWMKTELPPGSKVLMDWKPYCPNFHGETFVVEHIPRAHIIEDLDVETLRRSGADYLVLSSLFYNRYFSQPESQAFLRQRFREVFQNVPIIAQFESPSGTYGFHNPTLTLFSLRPEDFARLKEEQTRKSRGEIALTSNEVRAQAKW